MAKLKLGDSVVITTPGNYNVIYRNKNSGGAHYTRKNFNADELNTKYKIIAHDSVHGYDAAWRVRAEFDDCFADVTVQEPRLRRVADA
jgi:hypothetical protein